MTSGMMSCLSGDEEVQVVTGSLVIQLSGIDGTVEETFHGTSKGFGNSNIFIVFLEGLKTWHTI